MERQAQSKNLEKKYMRTELIKGLIDSEYRKVCEKETEQMMNEATKDGPPFIKEMS